MHLAFDQEHLDVSSYVDVIRGRATHQPNQIAYIYVAGGAEEEVRLTYSELDKRARAIAALLRKHGAVDECILLLYPSNLDFLVAFMGCLYARCIAVSTYLPAPAHLNRTLSRFHPILEHVRPKFVLTSAQTIVSAKKQFLDTLWGDSTCWLASDTIAEELADQWQPLPISGDTLAFLQFTSGSTSTPKGVMVSHSNLLANNSMIADALQFPRGGTMVNWLPLFHDMGLITSALEAPYLGELCVMMSPLTFLQRPLLWLQLISRFRAYFTGTPPFALDLCLKKITPEQRATLDLSSLGLVSVAAERVHYEVLERFANYFAPCGLQLNALYPSYGLAEATVFASGGERGAYPVVCSVRRTALEQGQIVPVSGHKDEQDIIRLVGCGWTREEQRIKIVDPQTRKECPADRVGEIWITGPNVAQGYWRQPEETAQTFQNYLTDTGEGPFMCTGDLGFFFQGQLYIAGRLKDLIIVDGRNHYPQDIELTIGHCHPALPANGCAAFSLDVDNLERLVVAAEVDRHYRPMRTEITSTDETRPAQPNCIDPETLINTIRQAVTEDHDVQVWKVVLLKERSLPRTTSGKIQRRACRELLLTEAFHLWGAMHEELV